MLSVNSIKPTLQLIKVRLFTEIKSGGFSIEIIMDRWSDTRVSIGIGRQVMQFIRQPLAMVISGELLQVPIILVGASSFIVQNVESSICSASSIPLRRLTRRSAKDRGAR